MFSNLKKFIYLSIDQEKHRLTTKFEGFISILIIFNAISAGIMLTQRSTWLEYFDYTCTAIYCFEIFIRYLASGSFKKFISDPLQVFDIIIITSCLIPEKLFFENSILMCLRVVRMLRIARFITLNQELSTIIKILMKSVISLYRIMCLMLVFLYVFGIIGMSLFRMPAADYKADRMNAYHEFVKESSYYFTADNIDPFGTVPESMFSLLKVISEQSWSTYRSNLIIASKLKVIDAPPWIVSFYFVCWFIFGAYLLLNLAIGAILQNYSELYAKFSDQKREDERERQIHEKVEVLVNELLKDLDESNISTKDKQRLVQKAFDIAKR